MHPGLPTQLLQHFAHEAGAPIVVLHIDVVEEKLRPVRAAQFASAGVANDKPWVGLVACNQDHRSARQATYQTLLRDVVAWVRHQGPTLAVGLHPGIQNNIEIPGFERAELNLNSGYGVGTSHAWLQCMLV